MAKESKSQSSTMIPPPSSSVSVRLFLVLSQVLFHYFLSKSLTMRPCKTKTLEHGDCAHGDLYSSQLSLTCPNILQISARCEITRHPSAYRSLPSFSISAALDMLHHDFSASSSPVRILRRLSFVYLELWRS